MARGCQPRCERLSDRPKVLDDPHQRAMRGYEPGGVQGASPQVWGPLLPHEGPGTGALGQAGALPWLQEPIWEQISLPERPQSPWPILALHQPRNDTGKDSWPSGGRAGLCGKSAPGCPACMAHPRPTVGTLLHWLDNASVCPGQRHPPPASFCGPCLFPNRCPSPGHVPSLTGPSSAGEPAQSHLPRGLWGVPVCHSGRCCLLPGADT